MLIVIKGNCMMERNSGSWNSTPGEVHLSSLMTNDSIRATALAHELSHALLGHNRGPYEMASWEGVIAREFKAWKLAKRLCPRSLWNGPYARRCLDSYYNARHSERSPSLPSRILFPYLPIK